MKKVGDTRNEFLAEKDSKWERKACLNEWIMGEERERERKQHGTRGKDKVTVIVGYGSLPRNTHVLLSSSVGPTLSPFDLPSHRQLSFLSFRWKATVNHTHTDPPLMAHDSQLKLKLLPIFKKFGFLINYLFY